MPIMNLFRYIITRRANHKMKCVKTPDLEGLKKHYERLVNDENEADEGGSEEWKPLTTDGKNTASVL